MVYGSLWYGRGIYIGSDVRVGAWHGDDIADELSADVHGFLPGLSCDSFCVAAIVLQDESYVYLCLFGPTIRSPVAQDGRVVLPFVKDDGWCRQVLRCVCYFAGLYLRSHGYSFCRDGGCDGLADMALYEAWGY